jgi:DNA-binding MarR family transcriptional regulator
MDSVLDDRITTLGLLLEAEARLRWLLDHELMAASDLPLSWYGVLVRLARTPGNRLRMSQLAEEMSLSTSGLTRLVDRIEEEGLVTRESCPTDRRGSFAVLSTAGEHKVAEATPVHLDGIQQYLTGVLSAAERRVLDRALRKVRVAGRAAAPRPAAELGAQCPERSRG